MYILRNKYLPIKPFAAVNVFGVLLVREETNITPSLLNHERIHTRQMLEMLFVFFYLWYVVEWGGRYFMKGRAYTNISFEREAYMNQTNYAYVLSRIPYSWVKYLRKQR